MLRRITQTGVVLAGGVGALLPTMAQAQALNLPAQADISRTRAEQAPLPEADFKLKIQNPEKAPVPRAVDEIEFAIARVKVTGVTAFSDGQVHPLFAALEGRKARLDDLRGAAQALEEMYRAKGYFLSRVFVPPQQVADGVFEVRVLEGFVDKALVNAPNNASRKLTEAMVAPVLKERPIRFQTVEDRLLLLNDVPGLSATSLLRPAQVVGGTEMVVTATKQKDRFRASFGNTSSDLLGPLTYSLGATLNQPFGGPGALDIALTAAGGGLLGLRAGSLRYAMPVGHNGMVASFGGLIAKAQPGGAIAALEVRSEVLSGFARLRVPMLRSRANSLYVDTGLTVNRSKVSALGVRISDDRNTVGELGLTWLQSGWGRGNMSANATLYHGLDLLGAYGVGALLPSVTGFRPGFTRLTYQFQRNQMLVGSLSAYGAVQGQYTKDRLVSGEQISFGGPSIGRGYDASLLAGENGVGLLGELRWSVKGRAFGGVVDNIQPYGFADWAKVSTSAYQTTPETRSELASVGGGLRFAFYQHLGVDVQVAEAQRTVSTVTQHATRFNFNLQLQY